MDGEICAYLAGYIDADGCLSLTKDTSKKNSYHVSLSVGSVHKEVLDWIQQVTQEGKVTQVKVSKANSNWDRSRCREQWVWVVSNNGMRKLLPRIQRCLKLKREQSELITEYLGLTNKRYGVNITDSDRLRKEQIYERMKYLNHRGVHISE